ncbi:MAG TPA: hypothetical protein VFA49_15145, partial [Chloroflexota bacterium]|nr:hypothetical protein [Chloroflexota bacterium]
MTHEIRGGPTRGCSVARATRAKSSKAARPRVDQQLARYRKLASAVSSNGTANAAQAALGDFETLFFNNMVLVLDRYYVHRLRTVTGKDGH